MIFYRKHKYSMNLKIITALFLFLVSSEAWSQERSLEETAAIDLLKNLSHERMRAQMEEFQNNLVRDITLQYSAETVESPSAGVQKRGTSMQMMTQTPSILTVAQFNALVDLYDSTSINQDWTNSTGWIGAVKNNVVDVSGWHGVETNTEGQLISLTLDSNNLNGFLPTALGDLTDLSGLVLPNNPLLTGKIPSSIGNLTEMVYLNLSNNNFTGSIPSNIGNLSGMMTWLMYGNPNLTGPLPVSIGSLTALETFLAADNNLNDTIPEIFGTLTQLSNLVLSGNDFIGPVPNDLGSGSNLVVLNLSDNRLTGPIPTNLGTMPHLSDLFLSQNQLTGQIPDNLGGSGNLKLLYLSINNLDGPIPANLPYRYSLRILALESNNLEGTIPKELFWLNNLTGLYLSDNLFEGNMTVSDIQVSSLKDLYLYGNGLSGILPAALSDLDSLRDFNIGYNDFEGTIPTNMMCSSPDIFQFNIIGNHRLYGPIPPCIANAGELINISGAGFTFSNILPILDNFSGNSMLYTGQQQVDTVRNHTAYYGYSFQLEAVVDRNTAPSSRYQWFRKGANNAEIPLVPASSPSGHTYTFDNMLYEGAGEYFYRIWNDAAPALVLTSKSVNISVSDRDLLDISISIYDIYCGKVFYPGIVNEEGCEIVAYSWDFGDGGSSADMNPVHLFGSAATYPVSLEVSYRCGGSFVFTSSAVRQFVYNGEASLPPTMLRDSLLQIRSDISRKVISASAVTYSGNWSQNHPSGNLREKQAYLNATAGVWRTESGFLYDRERNYSSHPELYSDGTFTLEGFNWENSSVEGVPDWTRANTATSYTPYGQEAESRDVLGVYSASLYGYSGQLLAAQGMNTKNREMAFTGFEPGDERVSGNWRFGNDPLNGTEEFRVITGNRFFAIVDASLGELQGVDTVSLLPRSGSATSGARDRVPVLCMEAHPENPQWSVLVFGGSISMGPWFGSMVYNRPLEEQQTVTVDTVYSHSGRGSLKITGEETYEQDLLSLDSGKVYHFSVWVSTKQNPSVPFLEGGIEAELVFKDGENGTVGYHKFYPSGPVIEQWQQIKGDFTFPPGASGFSLVIDPGSNPVLWTDDLRLFPTDGNMQSYVYDYTNHRLMAILNEENFGTFFYYDMEGNLRLVKKETVDGIKTLSETEQYLMERD